MAVARLNFFNLKKFGDKQRLAKEHDVDNSRFSMAMAVLTYASDLSDKVLAGTLGLSAAYEQAKERKEEQASYADGTVAQFAQPQTIATHPRARGRYFGLALNHLIQSDAPTRARTVLLRFAKARGQTGSSHAQL